MLRDVSCLQIINIQIMKIHMPLIKWAKNCLQNGGKSPPSRLHSVGDDGLPTIADIDVLHLDDLLTV